MSKTGRVTRFPAWLLAGAALAMASQTARPQAKETAERVASASPTPGSADDAITAWMNHATPPAHESSKVLRRGGAERSHARSGRPGDGVRATVRGMGLVWPMTVVLGLIVVAAIAAKRWLPLGVRPAGRLGVHILTRQYLSNKQSLCLLRLGRRLVLVGVTPERINALAEVQDADEAATIIGAIQQAAPGSFSSTLAGLTSKSSVASAATSADDGGRLTVQPSLVRAGGQVRELIEKFRCLSGSGASAEPT